MQKSLLIVTIALMLSLVINGALYFVITQKNSEITSLNQQIEELTNDFESLNSNFQEYKNNHSHTNNEYDELMNNYEQLTQTYENYVANHTFSNSQYTILQNQAADLQNQLDELSDNYQDLLDDYDELLADYRLINEPVSQFDTIDNFQIELNINKTIHSYTDSMFGSVSVYYTNGTAFQGSFYINVFFEGGGGVSTGDYEINGYGEFTVESPMAFNYGPGEYTVNIGHIKNLEGYIVVDWEDLYENKVTVEAK